MFISSILRRGEERSEGKRRDEEERWYGRSGEESKGKRKGERGMKKEKRRKRDEG